MLVLGVSAWSEVADHFKEVRSSNGKLPLIVGVSEYENELLALGTEIAAQNLLERELVE